MGYTHRCSLPDEITKATITMQEPPVAHEFLREIMRDDIFFAEMKKIRLGRWYTLSRAEMMGRSENQHLDGADEPDILQALKTHDPLLISEITELNEQLSRVTQCRAQVIQILGFAQVMTLEIEANRAAHREKGCPNYCNCSQIFATIQHLG